MSTTYCPCGDVSSWLPLGDRLELSRGRPEMVEVEYRVCVDCGAITKLPHPPEQELQRYYQAAWQYSSERQGLERAAEFILRWTRQYDGAGRFPLKAGPGMGETSFVGNGALLEVASKGSGIAQALTSLGMRLTGSSGLDAQPQREGIEPAWLGKGTVPEQENALVVAAHVLEHVPDPYLFLQDLFRLTASEGFIYVEVPSLQAGQFDVGLCDDINRNHLWHFTKTSLVMLGSRLGTVIASETDTSLPGWPVERLLLQKREPMASSALWFSIVSRDAASEYAKAELALYGRVPETTALYGASHSYAQIRFGREDSAWADAKRWKVYDLYKAGEDWKGVTIRHPSKLMEDGIREVFVTTRSYNSYLDIKRDLWKSHPWLQVYSLYPNIRAACGEEDPPIPTPYEVIAPRGGADH